VLLLVSPWDRIQGGADLLSSLRMSRALSGVHGVSIFTVCFNETDMGFPGATIPFPMAFIGIDVTHVSR
jgi:hypothetical protein